jgi:hypothetical protein
MMHVWVAMEFGQGSEQIARVSRCNGRDSRSHGNVYVVAQALIPGAAADVSAQKRKRISAVGAQLHHRRPSMRPRQIRRCGFTFKA